MKKWIKYFISGVIILITLIAFFYAEEDYRGAREWAQTKQEFERKGINLDISSLIPPAVPDDQNFAATPVLAGLYDYKEALNDKGGLSLPKETPSYSKSLKIFSRENFTVGKIPKQDRGDWRKLTFEKFPEIAAFYQKNPDFPHPPTEVSPPEAVIVALSKYDDLLAELHHAAQRPLSRFLVHYEKLPIFLQRFPHLSAALGISYVLSLHASAEREAGHPNEALDDLAIIWKCQQGLSEDPILISELSSISMTQSVLQVVWEGLARKEWSDKELITIQNHYAAENILETYHRSIQSEACFILQTIEWIKVHKGDVECIYGPTSKKDIDYYLDNIDSGIIPIGWFDLIKGSLAKIEINECLRLCDPINHLVKVDDAAKLDRKLEKISPFDLYITRSMVPAISSFVTRTALNQVEIDQVVTACALERFHLKYGNYPSELSTLVPEFLPAVINDVIDGRPLRYVIDNTNSRYKLYSIGWNQKDDEGTVVLTSYGDRIDEKQGDWVWAYPAGNGRE